MRPTFIAGGARPPVPCRARGVLWLLGRGHPSSSRAPVQACAFECRPGNAPSEHLVQRLHGHLHAEEARGIRGEGAQQSGRGAPVQARDAALRDDTPRHRQHPRGGALVRPASNVLRLYPALDDVEGQRHQPVAHAGESAAQDDGSGAEGSLARGRQRPLDVFVHSKISHGAAAVAQQSGEGAAEHGADTLRSHEVLDHVARARKLLGRLCARPRSLGSGVLHLQDALDALSRCHDERGGDRGQRARRTDVHQRQLTVFRVTLRLLDHLLAQIVRPEAERKNGCDAHERGRHSLVQPSDLQTGAARCMAQADTHGVNTSCPCSRGNS